MACGLCYGCCNNEIHLSYRVNAKYLIIFIFFFVVAATMIILCLCGCCYYELPLSLQCKDIRAWILDPGSPWILDPGSPWILNPGSPWILNPGSPWILDPNPPLPQAGLVGCVRDLVTDGRSVGLADLALAQDRGSSSSSIS